MSEKMLTAKAVTDKLRISFALFTRLQQRETFPRSVASVDGRPRWSELEIDRWKRSLPRHERITRRRGYA